VSTPLRKLDKTELSNWIRNCKQPLHISGPSAPPRPYAPPLGLRRALLA